MKLLLAAVSIAALSACDPTGSFDPVKCDYEQAQFTTAPAPVDRAEWVDYNGDGVVVLCMWVPDEVVPPTTVGPTPPTTEGS